MKRIIPDIIFSNLMEEKKEEENLSHILNIETKEKRNKKIKSRITKRRRNGKCYLCGKYGLFQKECWNNRRNKSKKDYNKNDRTRK